MDPVEPKTRVPAVPRALPEKSRSLFRLRIELLDVKPAIWRGVLVPGSITLPKLHMTFQHAMGWTDSHLHEFVIGGRRYSVDLDDDWGPAELIDERRFRLEKVLGPRVRTFDYLYDFGDNWHHAVIVEERDGLAPEDGRWPVCVAGERACPPEDVGGPWGYADFVDIVSNPRHPEYRSTLAWCGGSFSPEHFDVDRVNERLRRIKA